MMSMSPKEKPYVCIHEERFQDHEVKLERLEARADHKDDKINQIIEDNKRMEEKIDKITESIHRLELESAKDDSNINDRVTSLESTVRTLKFVVTVLVAIVPIMITLMTLILG